MPILFLCYYDISENTLISVQIIDILNFGLRKIR